ncbi:MAG: S1C family serine protease [Patescibacteria group bacterium]
MTAKPKPPTATQEVSNDPRVNVRDDALAAVYAKPHHFELPHEHHGLRLIANAIVAVVFGMIAGVVGLLLFISGAFSRVPYLGSIDVAALVPSAPVTIERTEKVSVTADERASAVLKRIQPSVVGLYATKNLSKDLAGLINSAGAPLATGIALTSDGWVLAAGDLSDESAGPLTIITIDGKIYEVERRMQDKATGLWFVKVSTSLFVAVPFTRSESSLEAGSSVLLPSFQIGTQGAAFAGTVAGLSVLTVRDSDRLESRLTLAVSLKGNALGVPLVSLAGEVGGLVSAQEEGIVHAVPVASLQPIIDRILKEGDARRPQVGMHYIELSSVADVAFPLTHGRRFGALLVKNGDVPAITLKSNAETAGLKEGDIVIKVDGDEVTDETDLATLIQAYPNDKALKLSILRAGEEKLVDLSLAPPPTPTQAEKKR